MHAPVTSRSASFGTRVLMHDTASWDLVHAFTLEHVCGCLLVDLSILYVGVWKRGVFAIDMDAKHDIGYVEECDDPIITLYLGTSPLAPRSYLCCNGHAPEPTTVATAPSTASTHDIESDISSETAEPKLLNSLHAFHPFIIDVSQRNGPMRHTLTRTMRRMHRSPTPTCQTRSTAHISRRTRLPSASTSGSITSNYIPSHPIPPIPSHS